MRRGLSTPLVTKSWFRGYNLRMYRAALFTLLSASVLTAPSWAQRGGGHAGGGHASGGHSAGPQGHSATGAHRSALGSRRFSRDRSGSNGYGGYPYFFPDYWYDGYDGQQDSDAPADRPPGPVVVRAREERPPKPLPPAQVIEIPGAAGATVAKSLPPTVFILNNGEKLESDRFVLSANSLSVNVHRSQRTIPIDLLNIDATIAANHDRGIDLRIPNDRNEISLRF